MLFPQNTPPTRFVLAFTLLFSNHVFSSTPSEMADLSMQQLLAISTDDTSEAMQKSNPWKVDVAYKRLKFDGYLDGTNKVSNQDVFFDGSEPRTDKNFPVLPTVIIQEALITNLTYSLSNISSITVSVPFIKQSTDHESIVDGYDFFNITTSGLGDITLNYSQLLKSWKQQQLSFSIGLSVPTGSIDETGDTPRAAGNQQLPYTMQLGSGTWDVPAAINYHKSESNWDWGSTLSAKARTGKNDRNYRLGNRFAVSAWAKWLKSSDIHPVTKLIYQHWHDISGQDDEITVPGPFPYPAGITNPSFYGGKKINLSFGAEASFNKQVITLELSAPIYQKLNGVQPKEVINIGLNWSLNF